MAGEILEGLVTSELTVTPEEAFEGSLVELLELSGGNAGALALDAGLGSVDVLFSEAALSTVSGTTSHVGIIAVLGTETHVMLEMSLLGVVSVTGCFSTKSGHTWPDSLVPH